MDILVTGGAGFIGSEFIRESIRKSYSVSVIDKLTYAGSLERLKSVQNKYKFYQKDISDEEAVDEIFSVEMPDTVVHFAAETHVDRSIKNSGPFIKTNVEGTRVLLDTALKYKIKKFIHISTDEVYGEIKNGSFHEDLPLLPNSPYSASKASADLLIKSYIRTYNFPGIIIRPSNNYGLWQYPEKFIPVIIYKALNNENIPVYGSGRNIREWLYVSDCVKAIFLVLEKSSIGEIYNVGSGDEFQNIDVVKNILKIINKPESLIKFVNDRPGHDYRYSLNSEKIRKLGWKQDVFFYKGLEKTVNWYLDNLNWVENNIVFLRSYWNDIYKEL